MHTLVIAESAEDIRKALVLPQERSKADSVQLIGFAPGAQGKTAREIGAVEIARAVRTFVEKILSGSGAGSETPPELRMRVIFSYHRLSTGGRMQAAIRILAQRHHLPRQIKALQKRHGKKLVISQVHLLSCQSGLHYAIMRGDIASPPTWPWFRQEVAVARATEKAARSAFRTWNGPPLGVPEWLQPRIITFYADDPKGGLVTVLPSRVEFKIDPETTWDENGRQWGSGEDAHNGTIFDSPPEGSVTTTELLPGAWTSLYDYPDPP